MTSILIVEDEKRISSFIEKGLSAAGYTPTVVENGLDALAYLTTGSFDLVLLDVGLPGIDGYEVARRVRASPGGDQLYLVALTGYGGPVVKAKAEEAGFNLQLTKPVDGSELAKLVSNSRP